MLRSFSFFRVFESRAIIVQLYRQCQIYLEFGENISDSYNEMIHHSYPMMCMGNIYSCSLHANFVRPLAPSGKWH